MNKKLLAIIAIVLILIVALGLYFTSNNGLENDFDLSKEATVSWNNSTNVFSFEKEISTKSGKDYQDVLVQMDLYKDSELIASIIETNDSNNGRLMISGETELDIEPDNYSFKIIDSIPDNLDEVILLTNNGEIDTRTLLNENFNSSSDINTSWDEENKKITFNKQFKTNNGEDYKDVIVQVDIYKGSTLLKSVNITNDTHDLVLDVNGEFELSEEPDDYKFTIIDGFELIEENLKLNT
ncbi:MAG: hypothetical protein IKV87_02530 [Methanobrevibacter sp.]|nr:hypothetical protein [Methanobrevibacter sp.]